MTDTATPTGATAEGITQPGSADEQVAIDAARIDEAARKKLEADGGYQYPESQTPWQEIQRDLVGQLGTGAILESAEKYQRLAQNKGLPRDSH